MFFDDLFGMLSNSTQETEQPAENVKCETEKHDDIASNTDVEVFPDTFTSAVEAYFTDYIYANDFAERIGYGEALLDDVMVSNVFKSLPITYSNYIAERGKLAKDKPISLIQLGIIRKTNENIIEGNRLKGESLKNHDLNLYEKGLWYLCCQK